MHGLPRSLHLDNGAGNSHSHALKRGCQQHGVRIDYRPPAALASAGDISRLMGTLMARVHALPGTTSSNVIARGDYPSERKAVLTLRELERILALEILVAVHHNEVHSALATTPAAAWADGVTASGDPGLPPDPAAFMHRFPCPFSSALFAAKACGFSTSPTSTARWRRCWSRLPTSAAVGSRIRSPRYECRVRRAAGYSGHLRIPCADLGRPAVTLWEQRLATRTLREAGHRSIDEDGDLRGHSRTAACVGRGSSQQQAGAAYLGAVTRGRVEGSRRTATGAAGDGGPPDAGGHQHGCQPLPRATHGERNSSPERHWRHGSRVGW